MTSSSSALAVAAAAAATTPHYPSTLTAMESEAGRQALFDYVERRRASREGGRQQQQGHAADADADDPVVGGVEMTPAVLRAAALEQGGYETAALNDRLYLHFRGFRRIRCLEPYVGLRALWLDSNGLGSIEGLGHLRRLRCLYLQNNLIEEIGDGLQGLTELVTLDISHNRLRRLDGLAHLPELRTLNAARNLLSDEGEDDGAAGSSEEKKEEEAAPSSSSSSSSSSSASIAHLAECKALTNLDLSNNDLRDFDATVDGVLARVPSLLSLNLAGNPVVMGAAQFRKRAVVAMPRLRYLDRPIFDPERQAAEAWARGGDAEEQRVRAACLARQQAEHAEGLRSYRAWAARVRAEREARIPTTEGEGEDQGRGDAGGRDDAAARAAAEAERVLVVGNPDGARKLGEAFWRDQAQAQAQEEGEEEEEGDEKGMEEIDAGHGLVERKEQEGEKDKEEENEEEDEVVAEEGDEDLPPLYDVGLGKLLLSAMEDVD